MIVCNTKYNFIEKMVGYDRAKHKIQQDINGKVRFIKVDGSQFECLTR